MNLFYNFFTHTYYTEDLTRRDIEKFNNQRQNVLIIFFNLRSISPQINIYII